MHSAPSTNLQLIRVYRKFFARFSRSFTRILTCFFVVLVISKSFLRLYAILSLFFSLSFDRVVTNWLSNIQIVTSLWTINLNGIYSFELSCLVRVVFAQKISGKIQGISVSSKMFLLNETVLCLSSQTRVIDNSWNMHGRVHGTSVLHSNVLILTNPFICYVWIITLCDITRRMIAVLTLLAILYYIIRIELCYQKIDLVVILFSLIGSWEIPITQFSITILSWRNNERDIISLRIEYCEQSYC